MVCMSPRDHDRHGGTQLKKSKLCTFVLFCNINILLGFMNLHIINIKQQKQMRNMVFLPIHPNVTGGQKIKI